MQNKGKKKYKFLVYNVTKLSKVQSFAFAKNKDIWVKILIQNYFCFLIVKSSTIFLPFFKERIAVP